MVPRLRPQLDITSQQVYDLFMQLHKVKLHDAMVHGALKLARKICEGEENEQYARLRDYANELLRLNPSSTVLLQVACETHEFDRFYVCLNASNRGFLARCKPLISLDGYFLKGYYEGQLLAAVSQDENNSFYIIAYTIVEVVNLYNWTWFLRCW